MQRGGNAATGAGAGVPAARARARPSHVYLSADRMPFRVDPVHGVEELAAFEALLGVTPEPPNQDLAAFLLEAQGLVNTGEFTWADYDAGGDGLYGDSVTEGLLELGIDPATIGEDGAPADDVRNRDFSALDADDCREPASLPRKRKALVSVQKIAGVLSRRALLIDGHWQRVLAQPNARCQTCHGEDAAAAAVLCYCLGPFGERLCVSCDRRRHQTAWCRSQVAVSSLSWWCKGVSLGTELGPVLPHFPFRCSLFVQLACETSPASPSTSPPTADVALDTIPADDCECGECHVRPATLNTSMKPLTIFNTRMGELRSENTTTLPALSTCVD
jgi:hypothetical protein